MEIKTSKNKAYTVKWIAPPIQNDKILIMQMTDVRRLPKIAAEFDGLTEIKQTDEHQGNKTFTGYSNLVSIRRIGDDVQIQMEATA